ncbi:MAG: hypothetical protein LBF49_02640 [Puniceicoccales bacterium]|jgi:hypothetical protein|nr:hypothetical protein [Puniceicoccales bacterium]
MERVKKIQPAQSYGQSGTIPEKVDDSVQKVIDFFEVGGKGGKRVRRVDIPAPRVSGSPLRTRSAVAAAVPPVIVPRYPGVHPVSLLWLTVENVMNLPRDEILGVLSLNGRFDPSKLAIMLFLPGGYQIANQVVERIPRCRLLKLIGGNRASLDDCLDLLFEKKYLERIMLEFPTVKEIREYIRVECGFFPEDLQDEEVDERITALAQTMIESYADEGGRRKLESNLRKVVDLIFVKLPLPTKRNQRLWDNIGKALSGKKGEKKHREIKERFPLSYIALSKTEEE